VHVFVAHALGRLVEQHEFRFHGQRGGDFQRTLAAVGQVDRLFVGQVVEPHLGEQLARPAVERRQRFLAFPEMVRRAQRALQAQSHVFQQREMRKNGGDLERADDAAPRNLCRALLRDVVAVEQDGAGGRLQELGQQIEASGFAGAVGSDQRMDRSALNRQVDLADSGKALEFLGQLACFKNDVAHLVSSLG